MPVGWIPDPIGDDPPPPRAEALRRVRDHRLLSMYYDKLVGLPEGDVPWAWVATGDETEVSLWLAGLPGPRTWPPEED